MSVMRWCSAPFLVGLFFFVGLFLAAVGLAVFFFRGLAGAVVAKVFFFFEELFDAVSFPDFLRSSSSNNDTRSAFLPPVLSPLLVSSSFKSTTLREAQSFEIYSVSFFLFRDGDSLP